MNADLSDIWEINLTKKLNEIRSLLARWGRRRLSIMGRITVIKSLALSKLVYLFLCLPNPLDPYLKILIIFFINLFGKINQIK